MASMISVAFLDELSGFASVRAGASFNTALTFIDVRMLIVELQAAEIKLARAAEIMHAQKLKELRHS